MWNSIALAILVSLGGIGTPLDMFGGGALKPCDALTAPGTIRGVWSFGAETVLRPTVLGTFDGP